MTSVQDYLRNLRAARKEFVDKTANEASPSVAAPAAAVPQAVASSPWLKSPAVPQPSSAAVRSDLGQGEPATAVRQSAARATSTPLKPAQTRPGGMRPAAEEVDSDTDTNISHLIDQLSLKSALKPPPAPLSASAAAAVGAAPRRASKMDMLRRKFSASSPTKSSDLGSSGGAASLGRARTRSRSSVSILDQKIILSGISGDEDSSGSSSSSGGTSSSDPIRTESAPGARRWRRSASDGEVSEELEVSGADSVVPTVPSESSVRTETALTAASVETESVETEQPTESSVQTEQPTEESVSSVSESTIKSASARSAKSKQARAVRSAKSDSKSESESESESESASQSESESESESSVVPTKAGPAAVSSESTPLAASTGGESAHDREDDPASTPVVRSHRRQADPASARADRHAAKRQEAKRQEAKRQEAKRQEARQQDKMERSACQPSKRHCVPARRDRDRSEGEHVHPHDTSARDRHRHAKRASKPRDEGRSARDSRSHRRAEPAAALERSGGAELTSPSERHRRRRDRDRDASWPEFEVERTDASESLVVSYQRRVTRSSGGCRHCCRQAWPPPPPPAVTVVVPPAALSGAGGVGDAVRFSTAANSAVFVDADEDAVLSAILTQQVALTRHFLATQKHLHQMYCRTLRQTQRQVYTHREDLKGSGRRRRRGGVPPD